MLVFDMNVEYFLNMIVLVNFCPKVFLLFNFTLKKPLIHSWLSFFLFRELFIVIWLKKNNPFFRKKTAEDPCVGCKPKITTNQESK